MAGYVAHAVKERREQHGLSLRALAARSGVSASMISDIERRAKSPTIATLAALADALEVPLAMLVDCQAPPTRRLRVVRAAERSAVVDPATGARRDNFGPALSGSKVEFLRYKVPPRTVTGPFPPHAQGTIEHVHLAAGRLRIVLGTDVVDLAAGDTCSCVADAPHSFDNSDGDVEALVYIVIEPV